MSKIGEAGFVLTLREFVFLAALTGAKQIYGIQDDTYKLNNEELEEEWDKIKVQLENKKYIEVDIDESITIDDDLYEMIHHCTNPRILLKCDGRGLGEKPFSRCYYINIDHIIELDQDRLMKNTYAFTPMKDINKMIDNLKECYHIEGEYESNDQSFNISLDEFKQIIESDKMTKQEVIDKIKSLGCSEEEAMDFYIAYTNKKKYIASFIVDIKNEEINDVSTFYIFGGKKYLWMTSSIDQEDTNITVSTSNIESINKQIDDYMDTVKKIYL